MSRAVLAGVMSALLTLCASLAAAEQFPDRPVRLVVPYPPGGVTDVTARVVAEAMSQTLGQRVIVDNRPGAAGNVGSDLVAKSKPDGYTILMSLIGNTISTSLFKDMPYDFERDFVPVAQVTTSSNVLVVHPSVPARTPQELIALAKARPGTLNYASTGNGTSTHLSGELFKLATGTSIVHVPYRGGAPAQQDLLSGQVQMMFDNIPVSIRHIQLGALRALATTGPERSRGLPDVPTLAEAGVPDVVVEGWMGIVAPAGTPRPVIDKLNAALNQALQVPHVRKTLEDTGATLVGGTPEAFGAFIADETRKWARVVKEARISVD
ncbi:tripartite tricarboxylate transporter substrate binding protein [Vineibacter terrae]|uniref:Tripartite tricarboxylate transporter substrate binding protein n=1 Tax=Vineibacter terrae TaxID=2586908 RepID=A0A5C8PCX9_9HYPH|nr:tripartite tricarboxylate transporter substrate binding protein [Vineibacter terrae]TXL71357.1 tripartite tricarboxylate transporter substrate binding protein [Vineibacter terrae]